MINKGKIYVIGIGPGNREFMNLASIKAIENSNIIVGYKTYLNLVEDLIKDKTIVSSGMRKEIDRCNATLQYAEEGNTVSLISSGDAGVYGMAGIMLEIVENSNSDVEIEIIPGVTAANAAASCLGAPIMHDYTVISLSDLLTDWELIKKRIHCAGDGDFVVCIYNPRSKGRQTHIVEARDILLKYKDKETPVGIVKNAKRDNQKVVVTTLDKMLDYEIDMLTTVIIGNSNTIISNDKMITPRGYKI